MLDRRHLPVWRAVTLNLGMGLFAEVSDTENPAEGHDNPICEPTTYAAALAAAVAFDRGPLYMTNPRPLWAAFCRRFGD